MGAEDEVWSLMDWLFEKEFGKVFEMVFRIKVVGDIYIRLVRLLLELL